MSSAPEHLSSFDLIVEDDGTHKDRIVPVIDGRRLDELLAEFEAARGYKPVGGYGGYTPYQLSADVEAHFLGKDSEQGRIWVLDCDCGEQGCWSPFNSVDVNEDVVVWRDFEQPHRPDRDYSGFGPFVFDRRLYLDAVRRAAAESRRRRSTRQGAKPRGAG